MEKIDARGLACPQPVLLAKKALEKNRSVEVTVDNKTAVENVTRLAKSQNCSVKIVERVDGTFILNLEKISSEEITSVSGEQAGVSLSRPVHGLIIVLSGDGMGQGNEELGRVLIRSFLHTLIETSPLPEKIICYNTGAKLAAEGSAVLEDLVELEGKGVDVLVCGTCLNYFGISDKLGVGRISNMYDIASIMTNASRLVSP